MQIRDTVLPVYSCDRAGRLMGSAEFWNSTGVTHYNRGRPHASLGPGIPGATRDEAGQALNGHRIPEGRRVVAVPILAGLHHEYRLDHCRAA